MIKAKLLALAKRCEKSTGPDRQIDADIFCALGVIRKRYRTVNWRYPGDKNPCAVEFYTDATGYDAYELPLFTDSIDVALTLIPDGHSWAIDNKSEAQVWPHAKPAKRARERIAATPRLSMCAAALRALSASLQQTP